MEGLEQRFKRMMDFCNEVELIDELLNEKDGNKKADYLWCNRKLIIEQKALCTDPGGKVQRELDKHSEREEYPVFYGSVDVNAILKRLPDGEEIRKRIYLNITRSLEDIVRSTEKQIRDTKLELELSDSHGVLVILNDAIGILTPEIIVSRVSHLLSRKNEAGGSKYKNIEYIWLIQENFEIQTDNQPAMPLILIEGPEARVTEEFNDCFHLMQERWADFNDASLLMTDVEKITDLDFQEKEKPEAPEQITRQELWERRYRANPYLRSLSDSDVLTHGAKMFETILPFFLKGGPRKSPAKIEELLIGWGDFLEEARYRALDLKGLPIEKLNKKLNKDASRLLAEH